jgi:hypothetical protein
MAMTGITKTGLDKATAGGCQHVGHDPASCQSDVLFLHFRCHPKSAGWLLLERPPAPLVFKCMEPGCMGDLKFLADGDCDLPGGEWDEGTFSNSCCADAGVWLTYKRGSGMLKVICAECNETIGMVKLAG